MKNNKTQRLVFIALMSALAMILNVLEVPYPLAPWLNFDLADVVVLLAVVMLSLKECMVVILCKFFVSLMFKGPIGPIAIGQIASAIASGSMAISFYFFRNIIKTKKNKINIILSLFFTMVVFAFVMFVINYLFVTPTYLVNKPTWYTSLPFAVDINAFNQQYGINMFVPEWLSFLSPYGQAIFIIYFPFNFLKGILCAVVYMLVSKVEQYNPLNKNKTTSI